MNRVASAIMRSKASSVRTCSSVARVAASESALPASVPPTPPVSSMSASASPVMRSARSVVMPKAPEGTPPAIALPIVTMSGSRSHARVAPPGPALKVCVSSMISNVPCSRVRRRTSSR